MFAAGACAQRNFHIVPSQGAPSIQASLGIISLMSPILKLTLCLLPYIVVSLAVGAYQKCIEITREA